ncbi:mediator of RNA polymerase II transcription subunit 25-like isoform X2 [Andrographis paniculata]|uniref:mediator of RNA polymerase II transcription subunit 25-like isoform X2 n=1 Tax=Andrographis paniculata TaxID=175694 RepID=UPI0021E93447|nr:mediator of RNA polymerase II transcription subunit 25-like isoform X2 [Andrographis paniculata]
MVSKQLIVAVEGTAAIGPYWKTIVADYLDKIVRCFYGNESTGQNSPTTNVELSLVMFNGHGSYSACLVRRSGWTRDMDVFLQWLSAIPFSGGGFNDAAIAEGLAEALMQCTFQMFTSPSGNQNQNSEAQRHCILIAGSNPFPLPTPVFRPQPQNMVDGNSTEMQPENHLCDAETLAKSFPQSAISLSVICPRQLPKLRGIYNAGNSNPRAEDHPVDTVKNPHFLILISENFLEARSCVSRSPVTNLPSNQNPVKADVTPPSVSVPPQVPPANGSGMVRSPISVGNIPPATVKVEPISSATSNISSVPQAAVASSKTSSPVSTSQDMITTLSKENLPDVKPLANNVTPSLRPVSPAANVRILNDVAQARQVLAGGTSIGVPSMGTPVLSNMISSGMQSSVPPTQTVTSSGQSGPMGISGPLSVSQNSTPTSQTLSGIQTVSLPQTPPGMSQLPATQMLQGTSPNMRSVSAPASMPSGSGSMTSTPRVSQQGQQGVQPAVLSNSNSATNIPLNQQQTSSARQTPQSKYIKVWEGNLSGQRQGKPVFITKMEGYKSSSSQGAIATHWPSTMQIVRLVSQDVMNNKQYIGKADFLVFRAMNQHGFLAQLQDRKLCAVVHLPNQTLLLSVSDKAHRLIGMLFPGNMVVFKSPPQLQGQMQIQQQQQSLQQMQQQRPIAQQMNQGGSGRSQLLQPPGQTSSQGSTSMPGGSFIVQIESSSSTI